MSRVEKIKILIVDDHRILREGIVKLLSMEESVQVVGTAANGKEALAKTESAQPQAILLDINLPDMSGIEVCRRIKKLYPHIHIIALTIHDEEGYVFEMIKAGASGYLLKDVGTDTLVKAIRDSVKGKSILDPKVTGKVLDEFSRLAHLQANYQKPLLSRREAQILKIISQGNSNKEIAGQLFISEKTVKNHIMNIFHKLEVTDRTEAVVKAMTQKLI